jgi:hypothetical protein
MKFETPPINNMENASERKEKQTKEIYINEVLGEAKNKLSEYFPIFYRDIPTNLDYQDNAEDLKISYTFEDDNLNINIRTPENLSDKTIDDLKKSEIDFLVFQNVAENETISKKTQDFFFLSHEYNHGINQILLKEYRPDIIQIIENKRKEFAEADENKKEEIEQKERNSVFPVLGESLPVSLERIMVEKILQDKSIDDNEENNVRKFWTNHAKSLALKKLEADPKSKYSELDEAMIYYKIYQEFGEKGIIDFIKNFDFDKLSKIQKYSDTENQILSKDYKRFLDMNAVEIMETFCQ